MPHGHDKHAIDIILVTLAGNEYSTQANLTHYDDLTQLEDDIISFLPTVSDIEVFGCEVDLIEPDTQLPLSEDFHTTLLQQNKLHQSWQRDCGSSLLCGTNAPACGSGCGDQAHGFCCLARLPTTADCQTPTLGHQS